MPSRMSFPLPKMWLPKWAWLTSVSLGLTKEPGTLWVPLKCFRVEAVLRTRCGHVLFQCDFWGLIEGQAPYLCFSPPCISSPLPGWGRSQQTSGHKIQCPPLVTWGNHTQLQLAVVRRKCRSTLFHEIFERSHKSKFFLSSPDV